MSQIFNALSGIELKQLILKSVEDELNKSHEFQGHLTFPWVKFEVNVSVLSYPKQGMTDEPGIKIKTAREYKAEGAEAPKVPEELIKTAAASTIDTPDQARADAKIPIKSPKPGPGGVLMDKEELGLK